MLIPVLTLGVFDFLEKMREIGLVSSSSEEIIYSCTLGEVFTLARFLQERLDGPEAVRQL